MPAAMQPSHGETSVHLILRILQPSQARFATFRPDILIQLHVAPWHQGHQLALGHQKVMIGLLRAVTCGGIQRLLIRQRCRKIVRY